MNGMAFPQKVYEESRSEVRKKRIRAKKRFVRQFGSTNCVSSRMAGTLKANEFIHQNLASCPLRSFAPFCGLLGAQTFSFAR
jgi:hypothetical protein